MTVGELRNIIAGLPPEKEVLISHTATGMKPSYTTRIIGIQAADSLQENGALLLMAGVVKK